MKIIPFIIFLLIVFIIVLSYKIKKNTLTMIWPIIILRIILPIFSFGLFGQIFLFLATLFDCQNGYTYVSEKLQCRTGDLYLYHSYFVFFAIIFHILVGFVTNAIYFKSLFTITKSDVLQKTNSFSDISLLITKIFINILFIFDKQNKAGRWTILFFLVLASGLNLYFNLYYKNKLNIKLLLLNLIFSWVLFLGFLVLFIGNIFQFLGFNGGFYLYLIAIFWAFVFILFYKRNEINFNLINYKTINNAEDYINYILQYYRLIVNKNNSRSYFTLLKSYIETNEENCTVKDCPLKIYLEKMKEGKDSEYLLYKYLDELYKYAISKFNKNIMLRINYAMFLIVRMNNPKKSILILNSVNEENFISFVRNYIKYLCTKIINKFISNENNYYINMNQKSKIHDIKENIVKATKLYYNFWQLLYESKFQHSNNFTKLYDIGSEIMTLTNKIDEMYKLIIKEKSNNVQIYKLYSNFIANILEDEEKYEKIQNIKSYIYSECFDVYENNYISFNIEIFKQKEKNEFLLISANKNSVGIILDCSTSASASFGYEKHEIIGKHLNILIPDILHKRHDINLEKQVKAHNLLLIETQFENKEYKPTLMEGNFFGIIKSKFIKSFKLKVFFLKTEKNNLAYMVEMLQDIPYMPELIKNRTLPNSNIDTRCCVLTNDNFMITSFTSNSAELLGLTYGYIKSNNSIFPHIKQLYEDYLSHVSDLKKRDFNSHFDTNYEFMAGEENTKHKISLENRKKIKEDLINNKYNTNSKIIWRFNENNSNYEDDYSRISQSEINFSFNRKKYEKLEKKGEIELLMEIKKCSIDNHVLGYYFYFTKLSSYELKNFQGYFKESNDANNEKDLKSMKYKTIIKSVRGNISHSFIKKIDSKNQMPPPKFTTVIGQDDQLQEEVLIDERFIPKSQKNFSFDLKTMCFNAEDNYKNSKLMISYLQREASSKIKAYQNYLNSIKKKNEESDSAEDEDDDENESNEESDSSKSEEDLKIDVTKINSDKKKEKEKDLNNTENIYKSVSLKNKRESKLETVPPLDRKTNTLKKIKDEQSNKGDLVLKKTEEKNYNNNIPKKVQIKKYENYYKVNLDNIHFLIFDFYKDAILEEKNKINSQFETILNNIKKNDIINKDKDYPIININKEEKRKKIDNNKILNNINDNNKINEGKSLLRKIKGAINSKNEEKSIKVLKRYSVISSVVFLILDILITIINYVFYDELRGLITTYKNIIFIKYCQTFSIYLVREQVLLNFNISNLGGFGVYTNIPAQNRTNYMIFIRNKLNEYLTESQEYLLELLSSRFSFSENILDNLTKTILISDIFPSHLGKIRSDIISNLIQYNAALYNLASSFTPLTPIHPDMQNFLFNSFNIFYDAIIYTRDRYKLEFKRKEDFTFILFIISIAVFLLSLLFVCIFMILSFIDAVKTRTNYMKVFYGINISLIRNLMSNCEKLLENTQKSENKNNEEDDIDSENIDKKSLTKNNNLENNFINKSPNNFSEKENKVVLTSNYKIYILFYIIFMVIITFFYPFNFHNLYNLCRKTSQFADFFSDLNDFHSNILDLFNGYRELIFSNKTIIQNMEISRYLNYKTIYAYEHLSREIDNIESFLSKNMNKELMIFFSRDICSFYVTDYFSSSQECKDKYADILKFPFSIFATNFLQNLRTAIKIFEYKFRTELIYGDLETYDVDFWKTWDLKYYENMGIKSLFRLDLYNNETLHAKMNTMFANIFFPYIDENRKKIFKNLNIEGDKYYFLLNCFLIIIFLVLFYLFYLFPMIRYLNNYIYRTKKMLLIIPMKIIEAQTNIKSLLNIK